MSKQKGTRAMFQVRFHGRGGQGVVTAAELLAEAAFTDRHRRHRDLLTHAVADAPASATAMDAMGAAFEAVGAFLQESPERVRLRDAIVSGHAELRERELIKLAALASAVAGALCERGIPESAASLAAETGVAVFKVAFARWIGDPGQPDLPGILRESMEELRDMLADRAPV